MIRDFRIGLYTGREEKVYDILAGFQQSRFSYYRYPHPVRVIFKNSSDLDWFSGKLPYGLQADIAGMLVKDRLHDKDYIDSHLFKFLKDSLPSVDVKVIRETPNRFQIIPVNEHIGRIPKIIGKGVEVPPAGKKKLLKAIDHVAPVVTVHSEIKGVGRKAEETPADPTPNIYLRPFGRGLKLEMRVQPFKADGPCFRPGEGGETVIAEIGDKTLRTKRDLKQEIALADDAMAACPDLPSRGESEDGRWDWVLKQSDSADSGSVMIDRHRISVRGR
jgi:hypothetical protein